MFKKKSVEFFLSIPTRVSFSGRFRYKFGFSCLFRGRSVLRYKFFCEKTRFSNSNLVCRDHLNILSTIFKLASTKLTIININQFENALFANLQIKSNFLKIMKIFQMSASHCDTIFLNTT